MFKQLTSETGYLRIDSEFHLKEYKTALSLISRNAHAEFGTHLELLTDGKHGGVTLMEEGVVFLRTTNIKENQIDLSDLRFISEEESSETKRAEFNEGDLLITTIGTIGLCAKVPKGFPRGTINQNLVRVVLKNKNRASVFCAFFNSRFGRNQLLRWGAGNVYQMINYPNLRLVLVPNFSDLLSIKIDGIYQAAFLAREQSAAVYKSAETLLLDTLGMADFSPDTETVNIKSFKDSFAATGRLDAEYYQPKYEQVMTCIARLPCKNISEFVDSYSTGYPYKSDDYIENSGIPLIRISNIKKGFLDLSNTAYLPTEQTEISKNDIAIEGDILISMSGTIGNSCVIPKDVTALINQRIMRFTPKDYTPLVLMLIINSIVGTYQLERVGTGGVQTNISSNDINKIIIPVLPDELQTKIAALVQQSFTLKAESERLLAVAKRAVEMAIEQDEAAALHYLDQQTLGVH